MSAHRDKRGGKSINWSLWAWIINAISSLYFMQSLFFLLDFTWLLSAPFSILWRTVFPRAALQYLQAKVYVQLVSRGCHIFEVKHAAIWMQSGRNGGGWGQDRTNMAPSSSSIWMFLNIAFFLLAAWRKFAKFESILINLNWQNSIVIFGREKLEL